jgi:hypothetical protein
MVAHSRLGEASPFNALLPELVRRIIDQGAWLLASCAVLYMCVLVSEPPTLQTYK